MTDNPWGVNSAGISKVVYSQAYYSSTKFSWNQQGPIDRCYSSSCSLPIGTSRLSPWLGLEFPSSTCHHHIKVHMHYTHAPPPHPLFVMVVEHPASSGPDLRGDQITIHWPWRGSDWVRVEGGRERRTGLHLYTCTLCVWEISWHKRFLHEFQPRN